MPERRDDAPDVLDRLEQRVRDRLEERWDVGHRAAEPRLRFLGRRSRRHGRAAESRPTIDANTRCTNSFTALFSIHRATTTR
ncbi:MAG: hypothetical protein ABR499_08655, partial [Gemmatimonadaceae bacterium]